MVKKMIEIKKIGKNELWNELEDGLTNFILFGGSRFAFVDEVLAAYESDIFAGAVTLSPVDEMGYDNPSIIGLLVLEKFRSKGIGKKLMESAIARMQVRKLIPVHIDVLSRNLIRLIEGLDPELKKNLILNDMSEFDCFETLEKAQHIRIVD